MSNHANFVSNRRQEAELKAINKSTASHTTSVDSLKALQTKTFTNGSDPTETLSSATDKQFSVVGGVDLSTSSFSKINPIKVDDNGLLECKVIGNTSADGTGTSHNLHVDSNGNAKTIVVNAPSITPHSTIDADNTDDPSSSIAVALKGRTTITDASTSTFLKCDTNGNLELNDATNGAKLDHLSTDLDHISTDIDATNLKLDDIKNGQTQNGDGTGNKLGVMIDAINTNTITQNSKIDTGNGELAGINLTLGNQQSTLSSINTEVARTQTSVHTTSFASIPANSGSTTIDLGANFYRFQKLKISGDMSAPPPTNLYVQLSSDGSNWTWATGLGFIGTAGGGTTTNFFNTSIDNPFRYWRFYNNDSVSATGTIDNVWYRVNQM